MRTTALLFLAATLVAQTTAEIETVLAKISTYRHGDDPAASVQLDEMMNRLAGSAAQRRTAEALLLKFLQSNATPAGKESAFRQLSLVGSNASIPVLSPLLIRIDTAEMARYALAAIPGTPVNEALRNALGQAPSDRIRIGLVNSLSKRKDTKAVPAIAALIRHTNPEVTAAAAAALAAIADRPALDALTAARKGASAAARGPVSEAYLVCADHFAERGETAVAVRVYQEMIATTEPASLRARALKSFAAADPKAAAAALLNEIRSPDPERQVPAIGLLGGMQNQEVTKLLSAEFPKLPPVSQVHLLTAIGSRADATAKPTVVAALKSSERSVRAAALTAIGRLGDESDVRMLAETAASAEEPERSAARRSLYTLRGSGVDAAIVSALDSNSGKVKVELILATGERAAASASGALMKAAQDSDPDIRREALRALRNTGGAGQAPALLDMLLKTSSATDRRDATQTLATVIRRAQPSPVGPVISAYNATPSREAKVSLLEVLGQTSSADALPVLRTAMKDNDPEIARAAILALSGWDTPAPLADLLTFAKAAQKPAAEQPAPAPAGRGGGGGGRGLAPPTNNLQVLALRGVLRLVVLQSPRSASESGRMLGEVMNLATLIPEKRNVLSLLSYFPSKESLEVAQAAARDQAVANEARVAIDQVAEGLKAK